MIAKRAKLKSIKQIQEPAAAVRGKYELRLYIAGQTPNAISAMKNLRTICEERLKGKYRVEVIDLLKNPRLGRDDQILAIPTLMRKLPLPVRMIIGNLSDTERVLVGLDLKAR